MKIDPFKLMQARELLEQCVDEHAEVGTEQSEPADTLSHGMAAHAAEAAGDAVFEYLNVVANHVGDPEAVAAVDFMLKKDEDEPKAGA